MESPQFDELIHAPARLSIMAMLVPVRQVEFRFVRDQLGVSDSALSKHLSSLQTAGYLQVRKEALGRGLRRTWIDLTDEGLAAFRGHVAALEHLIGPASQTPAAPERQPDPSVSGEH